MILFLLLIVRLNLYNIMIFRDNNKMYFGDAKDSLQRLSTELKTL